MTDPQPETPTHEEPPPAAPPGPQPEPRLQQASGKRRVAISRAVTWLLAVVAIGALASAAFLGLLLYRDIEAQDTAEERHRQFVERWAAEDEAARARVDWLAQEHDASVERWNRSFERADDLRQRCVRGDDVGFEWVTELGAALAHAERALEAGNAAVEGAHAIGQTELADRLSRTVSDNTESWAAERTRHSLLVSSPLALNCS